jgi:3-oxoacyl-[acyl-carrier-protein] synthase III
VTPVCIRALGTATGEIEIDPAEFATSIGTTVEVVRRWLGGMRICTTQRTATELASEAARQCLARAGVVPADVDAIVWCAARGLPSGRNELHLQALLGADRAFALEAGNTCSDLVSALWLAHAMVRDWPEIRRVLVACGDVSRALPRTLIGMKPSVRYQPVFSDVAAAALVEPGAATTLLGIGAASDGSYWDYLDRVAGDEDGVQNLGSLARVMIEASRLNKLALARCLASAGITVEEVDHLVLTRESPEVLASIVRQLHLDPDRLIKLEARPSHAGASDGLYGLEALMYGYGRPGETVLIGSRTPGITRFALFRLGERPGQPGAGRTENASR